MRIHYFQHVPFEGLGCIETWTQEKGHTLTYTRFYEEGVIPSVDEYDWLIIMGGPMGVDDEDGFSWLKAEKKAIKEAIKHKKKMLGICLGSQLIASVLGAKVYSNKEKEIGWFNITVDPESYALFGDREDRFPVFHWHGDTFELPEGAQLLASSDACKNQGYLVDQRIIGLQFHFEVTEESLESMVQNGKNELLEKSPYIQPAPIILAKANLVFENNRKMYAVLDYLFKA